MMRLTAFLLAVTVGISSAAPNAQLAQVEDSPNATLPVAGGRFRSFSQAQAHGIATALLVSQLTDKKRDRFPALYGADNNLIALAAPPPVPAVYKAGDDDDWDLSIFKKRSVQFWVQKEFLKLYQKWGLILTTNEISSAKTTFEKFKLDEYSSKSKSGVIINADNVQLKKIVDQWVSTDALTKTDGDILKASIDGQQGQQDNKDFSHKRGNGELVFSRFAYINLQVKTNDKPTGTLIYLLRTFKFKLANDVKVERTQKCVLWGLVCETKVKVTSTEHTMTGQETTDMGNFMKYSVSQDYDESSGPYVKYLVEECDRYARFLPDVFKDDWQKINAQPDKDPAEVLPDKNALDPKNYEL